MKKKIVLNIKGHEWLKYPCRQCDIQFSLTTKYEDIFFYFTLPYPLSHFPYILSFLSYPSYWSLRVFLCYPLPLTHFSIILLYPLSLKGAWCWMECFGPQLEFLTWDWDQTKINIPFPSGKGNLLVESFIYIQNIMLFPPMNLNSCTILFPKMKKWAVHRINNITIYSKFSVLRPSSENISYWLTMTLTKFTFMFSICVYNPNN